jgi:hypothetical protein
VEGAGYGLPEGTGRYRGFEGVKAPGVPGLVAGVPDEGRPLIAAGGGVVLAVEGGDGEAVGRGLVSGPAGPAGPAGVVPGRERAGGVPAGALVEAAVLV